MTQAVLGGRRFRVRGLVGDVHEHDAVIWADLWGAGVAHAHLTGTRIGDTVRYAVVVASQDGAVRTWDAAGTITQDPVGRVRVTGRDADDTWQQIGATGTVLFVCTGNFYRSRFAERLFDHLAVERELDWRATSRGLRAWDTGRRGTMSPHTIEALAARGVIVTPSALRPPALATPTDLEAATRVIALDEAEHRPMVAEWLGAFADRFEFWSVPDVGDLDPAVAVERIDVRVRALVDELQAVGNST